MTSTSATSHTWYLDADDYYVAAQEADAYPVRQGGLFPADFPELTDWDACQLVHPTCELKKQSVTEVQVIRVGPLAGVDNDVKQQAVATVGFSEKDGVFRVAQAHTFFLPPYMDGGAPMFSNFREVQTVARDGFTTTRRLAALTHDARVTFIRREIHFRYRLGLTFEDVRAMEARRISNDGAFEGPRPSWAPPAN